MKAAIYARCSTLEQEPENQLRDLRAYCELRGWTIVREFVDRGISGTKDRRPALDELVKDARRRRFDVVCAWKLDRIGRNLRHLVLLLDEFQAIGVAVTTLGESIDTSTAAGRLQTALLSAVAAFERDRLVERVHAGLARARAQGRHLGRPKGRVPIEKVESVEHLSISKAAAALGVSEATVKRWRRVARETPSEAA